MKVRHWRAKLKRGAGGQDGEVKVVKMTDPDSVSLRATVAPRTKLG